jgi:hypothetical protein
MRTASPSRRFLGAIVAISAVILAGCGFSGAPAEVVNWTDESSSDQHLGDLANANFVIEGTYIGPSAIGEDSTFPYYRFEVRKVIWVNPERLTVDGAVEVKVPEVGAIIDVRTTAKREIPDRATVTIFGSETYAAPGRYESYLEVDSATGSLVRGSAPVVEAQLTAVAAEYPQDAVGALVELAEELTDQIRDRLSTGREWDQEVDSLERAGPVAAVAFADEEPESALDVFVATPWVARQLPDSESDLEPVRTATEHLGLGDWQWREYLIVYDSSAADAYAWAAVEIPGAGILGPVFIDPGYSVVPIDGYVPLGQESSTMVLWRTAGDVPFGTPPTPEAFLDERVKRPALAKLPKPIEGMVTVVWLDSERVELVSRADADALIGTVADR